MSLFPSDFVVCSQFLMQHKPVLRTNKHVYIIGEMEGPRLFWFFAFCVLINEQPP